jgi:drug/metabolite transporter (DMT)-like permease
MLSTEALALTYGLSSAVSWGAGDFSGGFVSRRSHVLTVVLYSQAIGAACLFLMAWLFAEKFPPVHHMLFGVLAGMVGVLGLIALYKGLAKGRMGIVAPLSALISAVIPIVFAFFNEGLPKNTQIIGFGVALLAVWLLAYTKSDSKIRINELYLPLLAGLGFGLFFIFLDRATDQTVLWPLVATRFGSIPLVLVLYLTNRKAQLPTKGQFPFILLAGIFDVMGNTFFGLATHLGRLDISAILASLYPAATVLLAWLILKEKLQLQQWTGVFTALLALSLIAA